MKSLMAAILIGFATTLSPEENCECGPESLDVRTETVIKESSNGKLQERWKKQDDAPKLDLFVMSLCPYGMEAENEIITLVEQLHQKAEFNIYFIADDEATTAVEKNDSPGEKTNAESILAPGDRDGCSAAASSGTGRFRSLHGQPEIDEGRRQLVIWDQYPEKFHAYLLCRNTSRPDSDWRSCAELLNLDVENIDYLARGPEGEELFAHSIQLGNVLSINLSPTLFIDGEEYAGRMDAAAIGRRVCSSHPQLPVCQQLGECGTDNDCTDRAQQVALCHSPNTPQAHCNYFDPVRFQLTVLFSSQCLQCDSEPFLNSTRRLFPGVEIARHNIDDQPASWVERYGIEEVPAYIFDTDFSSTARFNRVQHLLERKKNSFVLKPQIAQTTFWPKRKFVRNRLDLFMPAAAFSRNSATEWVLELEEDIIDVWKMGTPKELNVHFLGPIPGKATSEIARRLCVADKFGEYDNYISARNSYLTQPDSEASDEDNVRKSIDSVRGNVIEIMECIDKGLKSIRLKRSEALADSLGLEAATSVTLLVNNQVLIRNVERKNPGDLAKLGI